MVLIWVVTLRGFSDGYQRLEGTYCLYLQGPYYVTKKIEEQYEVVI